MVYHILDKVCDTTIVLLYCNSSICRRNYIADEIRDFLPTIYPWVVVCGSYNNDNGKLYLVCSTLSAIHIVPSVSMNYIHKNNTVYKDSRLSRRNCILPTESFLSFSFVLLVLVSGLLA